MVIVSRLKNCCEQPEGIFHLRQSKLQNSYFFVECWIFVSRIEKTIAKQVEVIFHGEDQNFKILTSLLSVGYSSAGLKKLLSIRPK
jgi:hypothetical protein